MTYYCVRLSFRSPVHFGGPEPMCEADTFFSALCTEAVRLGLLERLVTAVEKGELLVSSLFPWHEEREGEIELYVPCPRRLARVLGGGSHTLIEVKAEAQKSKQMKKRRFIRSSELRAYLKGKVLTELPHFGEAAIFAHFNGRTRKPFSVEGFSFGEGSGLYFILKLEREDDISWLATILGSLSLSGLGGRKSSGSGRFTLTDANDMEYVEDAFMELDDSFERDYIELFKLLKDKGASSQLALSPVIPAAGELALAAKATGELIRRGGFALSEEGEAMRTASVYGFASGTCFPARLTGRIADVSEGRFGHSVYKYGKGLFLGVRA